MLIIPSISTFPERQVCQSPGISSSASPDFRLATGPSSSLAPRNRHTGTSRRRVSRPGRCEFGASHACLQWIIYLALPWQRVCLEATAVQRNEQICAAIAVLQREAGIGHLLSGCSWESWVSKGCGEMVNDDSRGSWAATWWASDPAWDDSEAAMLVMCGWMKSCCCCGAKTSGLARDDLVSRPRDLGRVQIWFSLASS